MTPRHIRDAHQLSRIVIAVRAGVSEPTVKMYEASTEAVTERTRAKLAPVYAALEATLPVAYPKAS